MKKRICRAAIFLICIQLLTLPVSAAQFLVPAGDVVGLELTEGTVTVAAFHQEWGKSAKDSGLKIGDKITHINENPITCAEDVTRALQEHNGSVTLSLVRDGKSRKLSLEPNTTEKGPCLGIYLKQGITGIGTVTFYDPTSGNFGVLGHGVNDQNGKLINMIEGRAYKAGVISIKKGKSGTPGQLVGSLNGNAPLGILSKNTVQGVFGNTQIGWAGETLPTAAPREIHTGAATIRSNIDGTGVREYSVEILKIYSSAKENGRNMLIKVTDPALLDSTGGIVQGMSGSPIIQDGKLVGAVTHVLVNDPTTGYGIFIENMLNAAA